MGQLRLITVIRPIVGACDNVWTGNGGPVIAATDSGLAREDFDTGMSGRIAETNPPLQLYSKTVGTVRAIFNIWLTVTMDLAASFGQCRKLFLGFALIRPLRRVAAGLI